MHTHVDARRRADALFEAGRTWFGRCPEASHDEQWLRVHAALVASSSPKTGVWRASLLAGAALSLGGIVGAGYAVGLGSRGPRASDATPAPTASVSTTVRPRPSAPEGPPPSALPSSASPPAPRGAWRPARRRSLGDETALLVSAVTRIESSPTDALRILNEYQKRFPRGVLRREAALAEVQAHLQLGQLGDAYATLRSVPTEDLPRRWELRALRAELAAQLDRCDLARDELAQLPPSERVGDVAARVRHVVLRCTNAAAAP